MPRLSVPSIGGGRKTTRTPASRGDGSFSFCARAGASAAITAKMAARLRGVAPVEVRGNVVAPLTVQEEGFVDSLRAELIVQSCKAEDVVLRALAGVVARGTGFHEEGPIA